MVLLLPVRRCFAATLLAALAFFYSPSAGHAKTVLLDFSSPTCGPCQQMRPVVQRLANDGFQVQEIDISRDPRMAARFGVDRVPTFIILVDDKPVERWLGYTEYSVMREKLLRATPAAPPRRPAATLGQSPTTFASNTPSTVAPIAAVDNREAMRAARDLHQPQPNRVVSLQDPNPAPARPQATAQARVNPFSAPPQTNVAPTRPAQPAQGSPGNSAHQRLLAATVRITVEDPQGKSHGTGTIVDARSGEALVLSCGHIFRSSEGKGPITITTFNPGPNGATPGASYAGHLIDFDLERDLALISLRPTAPVSAVSIAAEVNTEIPVGAAVTSVGCNHGDNPTAIDSRVSANNRYLGAPNIEVAGAPVEGRSGGGLFNAQGELVGVCHAADPLKDEGLYAALDSIYAKLDSLKLTMIYQPEVALSTEQPPAAQQLAVRGQEPESPNAIAPLPPQTPALPAVEQATLEEIQRRGMNSEVICIIRPQDPHGKSEVITISKASPAFVQALANPESPALPRTRAAAAAGQLLR